MLATDIDAEFGLATCVRDRIDQTARQSIPERGTTRFGLIPVGSGRGSRMNRPNTLSQMCDHILVREGAQREKVRVCANGEVFSVHRCWHGPASPIHA